MQRLIRSFNTLTDELKETLQEQYPDGIDASHIKTIPTAKGDILRVIELRTPEAMYLIKINAESRAEIEEFLDQESDASVPADDIEEDAGLEGAEDAGDEGDEESDDMEEEDDEEEDGDEDAGDEGDAGDDDED
ncbi:MAG: hypothetical protein QY325_07360 [Flavobacteriales bacterium]|jgi:hypothetical protein|nr:MAG: hypothetical protein QY325_07360 [Flavobacteriales bacterium]